MKNDQDCQMKTGAQMMENWTDDLGDAALRLQDLLDCITKIQQEMSGGTIIAQQFLLMALMDVPFQADLFKKIDVAVLVNALDRAGDRVIIKFDEAVSYLKAHRGLD